MFLFYFIIFIFGLAVGSFLNVVIFRLENGEEIINDRSKCLKCKHVLVWHDLAPILSFVFLKGKCRYCKQPISMQYPLVELVAGGIFILIFNLQFTIFNQFTIYNFQSIYNLQFLASTSFLLFIASSLIVIFVYDLKHYIIPDRVVFLAVVVALGFNLLSDFIGNHFQFLNFLISKFPYFSISDFQFLMFNVQNSQFINYLFAAFLAGGFFLAIVLLTKGNGMGGGDVKLGFLMGMILGWPAILLAVFSSFIFGSIAGLYLIAVGRKKMKSMIPFGPFLVVGTFTALFWGEEITRWYFRLIL